MAKRREAGGRRERKGTKGDVTFFGEESNKEPVYDVKVKLIKLEGGTAAPPPVAGESLNRPDESKLSSVRFLLSPSVWLCQPCVQLRCPLPRVRWLGAENRRGGWQ